MRHSCPEIRAVNPIVFLEASGGLLLGSSAVEQGFAAEGLSMQASDVGMADPTATWDALASDSRTLLIDVRTQAEWAYVGVVDLSSIGREPVFIEWQSFPGMTVNEDFAEAALAAAEEAGAERLFFLCRSGVRSLKAGLATLEAAQATGRKIACVNVVEGFEGDLNPDKKRGLTNGWKARGLPWRQS